MAPPNAEFPGDFNEALKRAGLVEFFSGCTRPHQREYLKWIDETKRPETRQARIAKAVKMLSDKRAGEKARPKKKP